MATGPAERPTSPLPVQRAQDVTALFNHAAIERIRMALPVKAHMTPQPAEGITSLAKALMREAPLGIRATHLEDSAAGCSLLNLAPGL